MTDAQMVAEGGLPPWRVLVVEDDPQMQRDVVDYLSDIQIAGRELDVLAFDFDEALAQIAERRADLIVLDVFRGSALTGADMAGLDVLTAIQQTGFVSVILYTAHPEKVDDRESHFVRLVGKDAKSLDKLGIVAEEIFTTRVPQMFRAISEHMEEVIRDYMWNFVDKNWKVLQPISGKPEFLRVILGRLGASLGTAGVAKLASAVFDQAEDVDVASGKVHPAEFYVMPPVDLTSIRMGDVRVRTVDGAERHVVVLWPSCDMVKSEARHPKTDRVMCAAASLISQVDEVQKWKGDASNSKTRAVEELLKNNRHGKSERYHFLPGLCDIPDLLIDFQQVEIMSFEDCSRLRCPATVASPFAESISSRFLRYIGRLGTPDVDLSVVMGRL